MVSAAALASKEMKGFDTLAGGSIFSAQYKCYWFGSASHILLTTSFSGKNGKLNREQYIEPHT